MVGVLIWVKYYITETNLIVFTLLASTNSAPIVQVFNVLFIHEALRAELKQSECEDGRIKKAHGYQWRRFC